MKRYIYIIFISLLTNIGFGQQINLADWNNEAKTNKRLLPKYGNLPKTDDEKKADQDFIKTILEIDSTTKKASAHLIDLGFSYYYRNDLKTAMYRFNQAYLLDSTNTDIYWGYGAIYTSLKDLPAAEAQYKEGLKLNPKNTKILTDYGTLYMAKFYNSQQTDLLNAYTYLNSAISYLNESYKLDKTNQNTTFKLSVCNYLTGNCDGAWQYYNECKVLGGKPISDDYTKELKKNCKQKK